MDNALAAAGGAFAASVSFETVAEGLAARHFHDIGPVLGDLGPEPLSGAFDRALFKLVEAGKISTDEALKNADSPNNLRLTLSLNTDKVEKKRAAVNLSLMEKEEPKDDEDDDLAVVG